MPGAHLTPPAGTAATGPPAAGAGAPAGDPAAVERAVLAVLTGQPPAEVAAACGMAGADLEDAVESYRAAGLAALRGDAARRAWLQVRAAFTDYGQAADVVADHLLPLLHQAQDAGLLQAWWYVRKAPHWRLRFRSGAGQEEAMRAAVGGRLDELTGRGLLTGWSTGIYEPESAAFGGPPGMEIAHRFFHADSVQAVEYLTGRWRQADRWAGTPAPRELTLLLCSALLRAAGLDWHEQGDVWQRVAAMRPLAPGRLPSNLTDSGGSGGSGGTGGKLRLLLAVDTGPAAAATGGPLAALGPWLAAAGEVGTALAGCDRHDVLHRGLRDVLAHHVVFHWNRLGVPATTQAVLAHAAALAVLGPLISPGSADVGRS